MFIRDFAFAVVVGTILLLLLSKLVGRVRFSLGTAFWCSLIGHTLLSLSTLMTGFIFSRQLGLALIVGLAIGCFLQAAFFQIAVRSTGDTIQPLRAFVLSLIVIAGGFFVASPLIEFGEVALKHAMAILSAGTACLPIALALAVAHAMLRPLSDGLLDTSMWVAKILAPSDSLENDATKQFLRFNQASLMDGWLSNIPLTTTIVFWLSAMAGFICHWWLGIIMLFSSVALGMLAKDFLTRSAFYYLALLYHRMVNRVVDYRRDSDFERLEAAESFCEDLQHIMYLHRDSPLRPPTPEQLWGIPYGDTAYWLESGAET